jgi:peptidyl-prolyl cis-trans isomerase A (cyclophilin A)
MRRMTRPAVLAIALCCAPAVAFAQTPAEEPKPAEAPKPAPAKKPAAKPAVPRELYATFVTSQGRIGVRLFPEQKPNAVRNFVELAEGKKAWTDPRTGQRVQKPLYDGTVFHRVIPGFMIQGGDPLGLGVGGPGYAISDELEATEHFFDQPCQLAYANSGPNSNGSQFFITEVPTLHLNPVKCERSPSGLCGYVRFGEGVCGCDLVGKIARLGNSKTTLEKVVVSKTKPNCQ